MPGFGTYPDPFVPDEAIAGVASDNGREASTSGAELAVPASIVVEDADDGRGRTADAEPLDMIPPDEPDPGDMPTPPDPDGTAGSTSGRQRIPIAARLLSRADLANLPQPEPLIKDTIDGRTVALLAGYRSTGKSFIALDWSACIATGKRWQGRDVERGRVLYVAAEGVDGLHRRLSAWEYAWRRTIEPDYLTILPGPLNLLHADEVAEFVDVCRGIPDLLLVVLDTLARCLVGGDENSARDMGIAVDTLYRIRDATTAGTVVVPHHTGKDKITIRGSSALDGGVDTIYTTEGDPQSIILTRTKRKDGPEFDRHTLRLDPTLDSAVLVHAVADTSPNEDQLMSAYLSTFSATGATKVELRNTSGLPSSSFFRALNGLVSKGKLINEGTDKRPHYRLADDQDE